MDSGLVGVEGLEREGSEGHLVHLLRGEVLVQAGGEDVAGALGDRPPRGMFVCSHTQGM